MKTIAQQKQELVRLIESVNNPSILEAIKNLVSEIENDYAWKETLNIMTEQAEEDIRTGRVYTSEEFKAKIDAHLDNKK